MKEKLRTADLGKYFRLLVVPAMFLAAISGNRTAQWCVFGFFVLWMLMQIVQTVIRRRAEPRRQTENTETLSVEEEKMPRAELLLFRQINHRITEQLKQSYPDVSWLWVQRPEAEELEDGGTWRIQVDHAEPYNFGEVTVSASGTMHILMILATPLNAPAETPGETAELPQKEPKPADAATWYREYGGDCLAEIIDDLNTQGHRTLTLNEDGEVLVFSGKQEIAMQQLEWFLPREAWPACGELLKEDGVSAEVKPQGLVLRW